MAAISLRGKVFDKIREDILKGRYKKGDELVECTIGKELGVSRTPVREAIRQLELEGLVQLIPNKGAFVTGISSKDVMDMYQIRAKLEGLCAAMAAENITKEQLEEMEEAVYLSDFHADKGNYEQVCQQDGRFHQLLYQASGSRIPNGFCEVPYARPPFKQRTQNHFRSHSDKRYKKGRGGCLSAYPQHHGKPEEF